MRQILPVVLLSLAVAAQTPPTAEPQPVAGTASPECATHDAPATFKAKVNLVVVPTVVRDNKGRIVANLTKEDFQLFDKGKPQIISRFSVEKAGGKIKPEKSGSDPATAEKAPEGAPPDLPDRYTVYLFDDVHLKFGDLVQARDAAAKHLDTLQSTERAAIYSTSGQTMLDFTDDRAKLHETLSKLRPHLTQNVIQCPDISYYMADLIENKHDAQALDVATQDTIICANLRMPQDLQIAQSIAQSTARSVLALGERDTNLALGVLKNTVRRISIMPGQRSIVLVSPGFLLPFGSRGDETQILDNAIRSNVIISALDARGLYTLTPDISQPMTNSATLPMK